MAPSAFRALVSVRSMPARSPGGRGSAKFLARLRRRGDEVRRRGGVALSDKCRCQPFQGRRVLAGRRPAGVGPGLLRRARRLGWHCATRERHWPARSRRLPSSPEDCQWPRSRSRAELGSAIALPDITDAPGCRAQIVEDHGSNPGRYCDLTKPRKVTHFLGLVRRQVRDHRRPARSMLDGPAVRRCSACPHACAQATEPLPSMRPRARSRPGTARQRRAW